MLCCVQSGGHASTSQNLLDFPSPPSSRPASPLPPPSPKTPRSFSRSPRPPSPSPSLLLLSSSAFSLSVLTPPPTSTMDAARYSAGNRSNKSTASGRFAARRSSLSGNKENVNPQHEGQLGVLDERCESPFPAPSTPLPDLPANCHPWRSPAAGSRQHEDANEEELRTPSPPSRPPPPVPMQNIAYNTNAEPKTRSSTGNIESKPPRPHIPPRPASIQSQSPAAAARLGTRGFARNNHPLPPLPPPAPPHREVSKLDIDESVFRDPFHQQKQRSSGSSTDTSASPSTPNSTFRLFPSMSARSSQTSGAGSISTLDIPREILYGQLQYLQKEWVNCFDAMRMNPNVKAPGLVIMMNNRITQAGIYAFELNRIISDYNTLFRPESVLPPRPGSLTLCPREVADCCFQWLSQCEKFKNEFAAWLQEDPAIVGEEAKRILSTLVIIAKRMEYLSELDLEAKGDGGGVQKVVQRKRAKSTIETWAEQECGKRETEKLRKQLEGIKVEVLCRIEREMSRGSAGSGTSNSSSSFGAL